MSTVTPPSPAALRAMSVHAREHRPSLAPSTLDPIRVLRRHAWLIVLSAIVGGVLGLGAYLGLRIVYPLYTGKVLFEVQPRLQKAGEVSSSDLPSDDVVFRIAQTETMLLASREVLAQAIMNPEIRLTKWHRKFLTDSTFNPDDAVDDLEKTVKTGVLRNSNLFTVSWSAHDPKDVPIVLNALQQAYLASRTERDRAVYDGNLSLFKGQLAQTQRELDDLGLQMQAMIRTANFTTLEDVWRSAQAYKAQQISEQLADLRTALNFAQTSHRIVGEQLQGTLEYTPEDVLAAERDPAVTRQIENIQEAKTHLRRYFEEGRRPEDAFVVRLDAQIRAMEAEREVKVQAIIRRNLEAQANNLYKEIERLTATTRALEDEDEKLQTSLRDLAMQYSQYESLKVRRSHLEVRRNADVALINELTLMRVRADASRVRMVQRALTPRELSFPRPTVIVPLGVLVMLGLCVGVVFLRELLDQRVKSASDLAVLPGARVLGSIPDITDDPTGAAGAELVVRRHPFSVLAESYRQACTSLLPMLERNAHQTLLLMGGLPGAGTTTMATNIAASIAATGRRVLVVDANFRRPRLAIAMGVAADGPGLGDLLANATTVDQTIVSVDEGVSMMPAGTPANRVFDRLNNGTFDSIIADLRGRFDLIIFDAPPAVVAGDAMALANRVDAAVLVVRANQEHRGLVARLINRLSETHCELLGLMLNRPRNLAGGYLKKNYATMAEYSAEA